jgi:hypothetical protein
MDGTEEHQLKLAGSEGQNPHVLSHMWILDLIQIQHYYEKQVMLRGDHIWEWEGKRRKLRMQIWLIFCLYKN